MLTFKKGLAVAALALTLPMIGVSAGNAAPLAPSPGIATTMNAVASHDVTNVYYRRWGGGYGYRRGGWGWGGAAAGLAAGAIIGGAIAANSAPYYDGYGPGYYAPPPGYYAAPAADQSAVAYCARRYRSYDPASGTYLNNDGNRYPCP